MATIHKDMYKNLLFQQIFGWDKFLDFELNNAEICVTQLKISIGNVKQMLN